MDMVAKLAYWINERENVRLKKEAGLPKPWSDDPTFRTTYFCNVNRENDRVTKFIRDFYSSAVSEPMFEYNIVFSRLINWPDTLRYVGFMEVHDPDQIIEDLEYIAHYNSKVWGSAYIVSTNGRPGSKAKYIAEHVMGATYKALGTLPTAARYPSGGGTLAARHKQLMQVPGLGSFMAAQVIADLKNTHGHPLSEAEDWYSWCAPGPGSLRGIEWVIGRRVAPFEFGKEAFNLRVQVAPLVNPGIFGENFCMQDFQNCLCEFDKYMRVSTGVGFSKRNYNGIA